MIPKELIIKINKTITGNVEIVDGNKLHNIISSHEKYNNLSEKICSIFLNLIKVSVFKEGNKRTAIITLLSLYEYYGIPFHISDNYIDKFVLDVAANDWDVKTISEQISMQHRTMKEWYYFNFRKFELLDIEPARWIRVFKTDRLQDFHYHEFFHYDQKFVIHYYTESQKFGLSKNESVYNYTEASLWEYAACFNYVMTALLQLCNRKKYTLLIRYSKHSPNQNFYSKLIRDKQFKTFHETYIKEVLKIHE